MEYDNDSSNIECILRHLAYKGYTEHLGFLQHWYRIRKNDDEGQAFTKFKSYEIPQQNTNVNSAFYGNLHT